MLGEFFIIKKRVLALLKWRFKNSDVVLDIGCGEKPYYQQSIKAKIVCVDIKHTEKVHVVCDAMSLPLKKSSFDGIICVNSLYYCSNPFMTIKEFSSILRKNGKLVLIMPFMYPIHDAPEDKYRFTEYGIKELLKEDFIIKEIKKRYYHQTVSINNTMLILVFARLLPSINMAKGIVVAPSR